MRELVPEEHKKLIMKILKTHVPAARVIAFGSRVRGTAKTYSDLDVCIDAKDPITFLKLDQLEESFAATDIPYKIDLVDFQAIDKSFQDHILSYGVEWTHRT